MASIQEELIVVKLSKLVKNTANAQPLASDDITVALEQVVQELVGSEIIVEVERT